VSSCSHDEPSSSRSIWAIARRFENLLSERSGGAAFVFGPDTLQTYLEAENEAVEKYCSHEEPSSRSISAIARRFENLHSERSGSAASHVSAGPAGERKLLSSAAHRFRFLFWPSNFDRLFFPTADDTMRYKWGECKCGYSMCPWVYKSGRFQGQSRLD
jgi:hypothetical protein